MNRRIRLSQRQSYALVAARHRALAVSRPARRRRCTRPTASSGASPPLVLTLIYATYAFGVLAALLLAGSVSDRVGRRPVLLVALGRAHGHDGHLHDRRVGRLAVRRPRHPGRWRPASRSAPPAPRCWTCTRVATRPASGLTNGVASAGGMGIGVLLSATLVQLAPAPRVLPYVASSSSSRSPSSAPWSMPEPVEHRSRLTLTPQRPHVPPELRRTFVPRGARRPVVLVDRRPVPLARPGARATLFHTLQPPRRGRRRLRARRLGSDRAARLRPHRAVARRGGRLGRARRRAAADRPRAAEDSTALFLAGGVVAGAGFGVAFLGGAADAVRRDPARAPRPGDVRPVRRRLPLASRCPAIIAGILVTELGLIATFEIFGSVVAAIALLVAYGAWTTRPRRRDSGPVEPAHRRDGAGLGRRAAVDGAERPAEPGRGR